MAGAVADHELTKKEMSRVVKLTIEREQVTIGRRALVGDLTRPSDAFGLVVFAHGSGSSRLSTRNRFVAQVLHERSLATLLFDLLTDAEAQDRRNVFDIDLLSERLQDALEWLEGRHDLTGLPIGLFGASTGAAAALQTAAQRPGRVAAVVSRGGRPDLASAYLGRVEAPTLLIVGGLDQEVLVLNRAALSGLRCNKRLEIVPGATHLFEEPGTLDAAAQLAGAWLGEHLARRRAT